MVHVPVPSGLATCIQDHWHGGALLSVALAVSPYHHSQDPKHRNGGFQQTASRDFVLQYPISYILLHNPRRSERGDKEIVSAEIMTYHWDHVAALVRNTRYNITFVTLRGSAGPLTIASLRSS